MATLPNALPRLAADPLGSTLGLQLPAGRLIDATYDGPWHEPLLWCAEEPAVPGTWSALAPARRAGLLPLVLDASNAPAAWQDWSLRPGEMSYPGDHDAEEFLAHAWQDVVEDLVADDDENHAGLTAVLAAFGEQPSFAAKIAPFGADWPGPAPAGTLAADPEERAAEVAYSLATDPTWYKHPRTALAPARRSADLPAAIGWTGPVNYEPDTARLCAVLRSWEDRFGIRVVGLSPDQLVVSVAAPPTTESHAMAVAAEHFAFCPDAILQGDHGTLREYALHEVLEEEVWAFWWN